MRRSILDVFSAINLVRNGGLDFLGEASEVPPFWELVGAEMLASEDSSAVQIVTGEAPDSVNGAANYFKISVVSDELVELKYNFTDRFIQMGFVALIGDTPDQYQLERLPERYNSYETQLLRGIEVSSSFSIRTTSRPAKISIVYRFRGATPEVILVDDSFRSLGWQRPTRVIDLNDRVLESVAIRIEKIGSQLAEIHVGSIMTSVGAYSDLPFTGDPMADAIPKDAIMFAFGDSCPQGFEKVEISNAPGGGRTFPKNASGGSLTAEGSERHDHTDAEMTMWTEVLWPTVDLIPPPRGVSNNVPADNASTAHSHEMSSANHVPPSKDVILCRRL